MADTTYPPTARNGAIPLRFQASNGHPNSGTSQHSSSNSSSSNFQSTPTQATSPPSAGSPSIPASDPRVTVSHGDGLEFVVKGTGSATYPAFPSVQQTVTIKKTAVLSGLSVESVTLSPPSDSCFTASLVGELTVVRQNKPRQVLVSFQASRVGTFHATLNLTFSDKSRPNNVQEFRVSRELRGRAALPDSPASNGDASNTSTVEDVMGSEEGTGITVSGDFGLDFSGESTQLDGPFTTETKEVVITKSSTTPPVTFKDARISSTHDSVTESFSAQFEGDSKVIKPRNRYIVTVSFTPRQEGSCEAALELIFNDHRRNVDFVVRRTLNGWARRRADGQEHRENGPARVPRAQPINNWGDDHASVSTDEEEEEEFLNSDDTGVYVSHEEEEGLDVGIVERKRPNGPFATVSTSITIRLADGFPPVTFLKEKIRTLDGSDSGFVATFEGDSHTIRPGTESTVRVMFNPKFDGFFKATLELVFYDGERSARFVVRRSLRGIAGSAADHKYFESLDEDEHKKPTTNHGYVPPRKVILLSRPNRRGKSRQFPDYAVPPSVQEAVEKSTAYRPYDKHARPLIAALRPNSLTLDTYAQYFNALLNVEDGHLQWDILCQPFYVVDVQEDGDRHRSIEIENNDEDLLPEVIVGDYLWLDDVQDDIRYEARITGADIFPRRQDRVTVLKMSLRLPIEFDPYPGAQFILRFRLNRITLRRQYHVLAGGTTPLRRLLFPSTADIKPMRYLSRTEIDNLDLVNENIRGDDQQRQTIVSILGQPKGSVPFIIFGPPGTGKTTTVVESIVQLVRRNASVRVLACTPSNAAADLLVERLAGAGLTEAELYRLNAYSREEDIPDDVQPFSVIPRQRKLLAFRVVLSTCSSAGMLQTWNVPVGHFSHIVIDEAAQAEEPLAMIPIIGFSDANTNIILTGDPNQLGPVIKSPTASKAGLGKSYLQRLMSMREVYGLDTQATKTIVGLQLNRRSHGAIIAWPNRYFYEDHMRAHGDMDVTHLLLHSNILPKKGFPIMFHGIKGTEKRTRLSPSYFNIHEASVVRNYCVALIEDRERRIYPWEIGVIAPYRAQVRTIRELLRQARLSEITVGSVEQFQGQERKVIIMATTRSNEEHHPRRALGFLMNRRRLNVAITRAQSMLIMVGDPEVLKLDPLWRTFLNYIRLREGSTGKEPSWKAKDVVNLPNYEIIPRQGGVVYGEEFIDGKSREIYRYLGND